MALGTSAATPGHPDFISEVERVLAVLDGAVLVLSAVEGVQPQTRILMRALQRLQVPTLLFSNKIDRIGADPRAVLAAVHTRLTSDVLAMGSVTDPVRRRAARGRYSDLNRTSSRLPHGARRAEQPGTLSPTLTSLIKTSSSAEFWHRPSCSDGRPASPGPALRCVDRPAHAR